jgi:uncharacterized membrane protein YgaE (UPF0421/DUF939 family)
MVVCALAMSLATLLGAGQLLIIQAGVQSILVTTLSPDLGYGVNRWLDAVIGCSVALLVATIAPSHPLRKPVQVAARVLTDLAEALTAAASALRDRDSEAAEAVLKRAQAGDEGLAAFDAAAAEGVAVVRQFPVSPGSAAGGDGARRSVRAAGTRQPEPEGPRQASHRCGVA